MDLYEPVRFLRSVILDNTSLQPLSRRRIPHDMESSRHFVAARIDAKVERTARKVWRIPVLLTRAPRFLRKEQPTGFALLRRKTLRSEEKREGGRLFRLQVRKQCR